MGLVHELRHSLIAKGIKLMVEDYLMKQETKILSDAIHAQTLNTLHHHHHCLAFYFCM